MRIYLDACCLNRLTDDQTQLRIRREAESVELILKLMREGAIQWIVSEALIDEIERNPESERRIETLTLLKLASARVEVDRPVGERARELQAQGYDAYDALHLACAEAARADVLLTTDDKFMKRAARGEGQPLVAVRNPLSWVQEGSS